MDILRVTGLEKTFGTGEGSVRALSGIDFSLEPGELMALLGPSGSGKTTLLLCICLILEPTAGEVTVNERTIFRNGLVTGVTPRRFRRENVGFIFQGHNLVPFLTVTENVVLAIELTGIKGREANRRAAELLEYLEIDHRANAFPATLSGGEQQRVAIARALANNAKLILADEPTASLDSERGFQVIGLLKRIAKERGAAVIVVTHDERMIEGFDTVQRMNDGRFLKS